MGTCEEGFHDDPEPQVPMRPVSHPESNCEIESLRAEVLDLTAQLSKAAELRTLEVDAIRANLEYAKGQIKAYERRPAAASPQDRCAMKIGFVFIYIRYLRPDYRDRPGGKEQYRKLKLFAQEFAVENHRASNDPYWEDFHDRLVDEFENLC